MQKRIIFGMILSILLLFLTSCSSPDTDQNHSQSAEQFGSEADIDQSPAEPVLWGDPPNVVKTKETSGLLDETEDALSYDATIFDEPSKIIYRFEETGLYRVYSVTEIDFVNSEKIFEFYDSIKQELTDKFGLSTADKVISANPQIKITGNGHQELLNGDAFLSTEWDLKDYYAKIQVSPDSNKALISINVEKKPEFIAQEINIGSLYEIPELCEFMVEYADLKKEVNPPKPANYYTYYPEEDGMTYLDVAISIKNMRTTGRQADQFGTVKAICGDGYEYESFSIIEEKNRSDFTYTSITAIEPLETAIIHYLVSIPNELADDESSAISLQITILDNNYSLIVR